MEPNSRAYFGDKLRRTRAYALKAEVITGMPYEKFADIQNIYKNFRQRTKLTGSKTKQYMTTDKRRARGDKMLKHNDRKMDMAQCHIRTQMEPKQKDRHRNVKFQPWDWADSHGGLYVFLSVQQNMADW